MIKIKIYKHQLMDFKHLAKLIVNLLNEIVEGGMHTRGARPYNYLAAGFGYKNHSDLVHQSLSENNQNRLQDILFADDSLKELIAQAYSVRAGIKREQVLKAFNQLEGNPDV